MYFEVIFCTKQSSYHLQDCFETQYSQRALLPEAVPFRPVCVAFRGRFLLLRQISAPYCLTLFESVFLRMDNVCIQVLPHQSDCCGKNKANLPDTGKDPPRQDLLTLQNP